MTQAGAFWPFSGIWRCVARVNNLVAAGAKAVNADPMVSRLASLLAHLAITALVAFSIGGAQAERAVAEIDRDRIAGMALYFGVSSAGNCFGQQENHGDCPLCRLEPKAALPMLGQTMARAMHRAERRPFPMDLALLKHARDATVQARAPPKV